MIARSAYVIQTQVISLGDRPLVTSKRLRSTFYPMFSSQSCFKDMQMPFLHGFTEAPLSAKPFIHDLGQIFFNIENIPLAKSCNDPFVLANRLGWKDEWWDISEEQLKWRFFGYDQNLKDQRMNHLYFELRKPLFLKATFENKTQADGKLLLHFYPCGYIVMHLAIDLKQPNLGDLNTIFRAIRETRPHRFDNQWIWSTRLGEGKLPEIIKMIKERIYMSLYEDDSISFKESKWHSAYKFLTTAEVEKVAAKFFKGSFEKFKFKDYPPWEDPEFQSSEYILSSRQGIIFCMSSLRSRKSALRLFWRIHALYEFVILKYHIYEDYARLLSYEVPELKMFRLSVSKKLAEEDLLRFSVYDPKITEYLSALDRHIQNASPFYRRIYSLFSKNTGFDKQRDALLKLVESWEKEIEEWDHPLVVLWKKVISPLRSLLGPDR